MHAFEDQVVIAGQGTIGLELVEQLPEVETVVIPIGGGGLASGIALALKALRPEVKIVGVQAAACAPLAGARSSATRSQTESRSNIRASSRRASSATCSTTVVTVTDEEISQAIVLLTRAGEARRRGRWRRGARGAPRRHVAGDGPTVVLLSGGNIDPTLLIRSCATA